MTKRLLVMRHGKAEPGDADIRDFDRALAARGQEDTVKMAQFLIKENALPAKIFASSAKRTTETAYLLAETLNFSKDNIVFDEELYLAPALDYVKVVAKVLDDVSCVMLVGHNPGVSQLIAYLTGDVVELKTAAIADIVFSGSWKDMGQADLKHAWFPKFID